MHLEVLATFDVCKHGTPPLFGVDVLAAMDNSSAVSLLVNCSAPGKDADCHVQGDATRQGGRLTQGPLLFGPGEKGKVSMHAIIDGSIIELIVNNRTAMVAYAIPKSGQHKGVRLFGAGLSASMEYWTLDGI